MVNIADDTNTDEIESFRDMRSFGASEAAYRLLGLDIHYRHPSVYALPVHLERRHLVLFSDSSNLSTSTTLHKTELTEFFAFNAKNPSCVIKYSVFPEHFIWSKTNKKWVERKVNTGTIGRINVVSPAAGDVFYLRILLNMEHCTGLLI